MSHILQGVQRMSKLENYSSIGETSVVKKIYNLYVTSSFCKICGGVRLRANNGVCNIKRDLRGVYHWKWGIGGVGLRLFILQNIP